MSKVGTSDSKNTLYCSFCGKSQHEVRKLIAAGRDPRYLMPDAVRKIIARERPDLLVIGWRRPGWDYLGTSVDQILRSPPCYLRMVRPRVPSCSGSVPTRPRPPCCSRTSDGPGRSTSRNTSSPAG